MFQNTLIIAAFLIVVASFDCSLLWFSKQARTSVHTISFVAHLQYFLHYTI